MNVRGTEREERAEKERTRAGAPFGKQPTTTPFFCVNCGYQESRVRETQYPEVYCPKCGYSMSNQLAVL